MKEPWLLIAAALIIVGSYVYNYYYGKKGTVRRRLKKFNLKKIQNLKVGETARVVGKVEFTNEVLTAPLSKRKCSLYQVKISERRGKNSTTTIISEEKKTAFYLVQNGHKLLVETANIYCHLVRDGKYSSGFLNDASQSLDKYLRAKGEESTGMFGMNRSLTYHEGVIEKGEEIVVAGTVSSHASGRFMTIKACEHEPLYITDDRDLFS